MSVDDFKKAEPARAVPATPEEAFALLRQAKRAWLDTHARCQELERELGETRIAMSRADQELKAAQYALDRAFEADCAEMRLERDAP